MEATGSNRGRPRVADRDALREHAIEILIREGYAKATMARIAAETGVSLRTLHRYFPSKADIVWGGIEGALASLRDEFERADERAPVIESIIGVVVRVFEQDADRGHSVGRARLRLIATTPELEQTRPDTYRRWREETIAYIARRTRMSPDSVAARAAGAAVQTVIMEALAWWASRDEQASPTETVARALHGLEAVVLWPIRSDPGRPMEQWP